MIDGADEALKRIIENVCGSRDAKLLDPDGHFKFPHLWPPKLPQGRTGLIVDQARW